MIGISYVFKEIRYIRYLSIFPLVLLMNFKIEKGYLTKTFGLFIPYIIIGVILAAVSFNFSTRLVAESVLILIPIVFVIFFNAIEKINVNHIKCFFIITVLLMFLEHFQSLFKIIFNPALIFEALITSEIDTESHFGFLFGLFFLYFLTTKQKKRYTIISFLFLLIALKRIAILAAVVALVFYLFYRRKEFTQKRKRFFNIASLLVLLSFAYILVHLSLGTYDEVIKEYSGFSANAFTKGRATMYKRALRELPIYFFGHGSGTVTDYLIELNFERMDRLHSDFLRNFIELGWGVYTIWIIFFNKINIFSLQSVVMLIFYWIIMATDNAFVYFDFLVLFYLIQTNLYANRELQT